MEPPQEKVPRTRKDARQCQTDAANSVQGNFIDRNKDKPKKSNDKSEEPQKNNETPESSEVNKKKRKKKKVKTRAVLQIKSRSFKYTDNEILS